LGINIELDVKVKNYQSSYSLSILNVNEFLEFFLENWFHICFVPL